MFISLLTRVFTSILEGCYVSKSTITYIKYDLIRVSDALLHAPVRLLFTSALVVGIATAFSEGQGSLPGSQSRTG